jgi:hypothetical protein
MVARESRRSPVPATMTGPLAEHERALRVELMRLDYAASTIKDVVAAMRRVSVWMQAHRLTATELTPEQVEVFLAGRHTRCTNPAVARRGLAPALAFLRDHDLVPGPDLVGVGAVEVLVGRYRVWLLQERGLAGESARCYGTQAKKFLTCLPEPLMDSLAGLDGAAITAFIVAQTNAAGSVWSAKALVTALRSLLRFLQVEGLIAGPLSAAVPAGGRLARQYVAARSGERAGRFAVVEPRCHYRGRVTRSRGAARAGPAGAAWRGGRRPGPGRCRLAGRADRGAWERLTGGTVTTTGRGR